MYDDPAFWDMIDRLVAGSRIVIDRPRGSAHPRYPHLIYPLDYGYLDGTTAGDGAGIDVWIGTAGTGRVEALLCTVDLLKRDAEVKLLIGCTDDDRRVILDVLNSAFMRGVIVPRPAP